MVMLLVIRRGIRNLDFIDTRFDILYLIVISILINFIFYGVSIMTLFGSFISVSFAVLINEVYKAVKEFL